MIHRERSRSTARASVVALALALGLAAPLTAQELQYTGSVGYATGSYTFTERTSSVSILNGLSLEGDRWTLSGSIPLIIQNSGDVSYVGGMRVPTGSGRDGMGGHGSMNPGTTGGYEATLGDPVIRGAFTPFEGSGTLRVVEIQAVVKVPIADPATGVGTGEWDVGGGVSAGLGLGAVFLFADAAVWSPGDLPDLQLDPYVTVSGGVGRAFTDRLSGLASVSVSTAMIDGLEVPATVGGGLSYRIGDNQSLSLGGSYGLTASAPQLSLYVGWSASP